MGCVSGLVLVGVRVFAGDVGICWCGEEVLDAPRPRGAKGPQTPTSVIGRNFHPIHQAERRGGLRAVLLLFFLFFFIVPVRVWGV